jgi:hypothetical protein
MIDNEEGLCSIPSDCFVHVLSYLKLETVVNLGASCRHMLSEIQPTLRSRRQRFKQRFYYDLNDESSPAQDHVSSLTEICMLPTVYDRIFSLSKVLSRLHPFHPLVMELLKSLSEDCDDKKHCQLSLIESHSYNIRPHKLHCIILRSVMESNPLHVDLGRPVYGRNLDALSVTLERYIGDVICAFYLFGHSASGIVEASPKDDAWSQRVMADLNLDVTANQSNENSSNCGIGLVSWYRAWIFLHSSLLRIAPFSWNHQTRLGVASPTPSSSNLANNDVAEGSLLRPHIPFRGMPKSSFWSLLSETSNFPPLRVTFNSFGPLGPTFRGRDMIESMMIYPASVLGTLVCFEKMDPHEYLRGPTTNFRPFLQSWVNGGDVVIQTILHLHEQARRTRPMNVIPPLISLESMT